MTPLSPGPELDAEPRCAVCGSDDVEWDRCWACHGDGEFDLHDEDPVNFCEDEEYEQCDECEGLGAYLICHTCAKRDTLSPPALSGKEQG